MRDLSFTEITNFLPEMSSTIFGIACRAVARDRSRVMLISFVIDGVFSLAYHEENKEPDTHLLNEILPRCNFFFIRLKIVRYGSY